MSNPIDTNQASEVLQGDCLELMKGIPDGSVNMTRKEAAGLSKLEINSVSQGDCLELMKNIADGSVDMILADLP